MWPYKSSALHWLRQLRMRVRVPAFTSIGFEEWSKQPQVVLERALRSLGMPGLAVRSDRFNEDCGHAGSYLSLLDIDARDESAVANAIDRVFASYGNAAAADRVLLQRYVASAEVIGVAASRALPYGQPYQVISWTPGSIAGLVTGALSGCFTCYDYTAANMPRVPGPWARMLSQLRECLDQVRDASGHEVEIEWLWLRHRLYVVQVRELRVLVDPIEDLRFRMTLKRAQRQLRTVFPGSDSDEILGLMPDWNPAELLGAHPRPFALSLFQALISTRTYRAARAELGYKTTEGGLLKCIAGRPYVRVSRSLASLLPAELAATDVAALVSAQLERLRSQPQHHDKIEFEIATSSYEFGRSWRARYPQLECALFDRLERALLLQAPRIFDLDGLHQEHERARFALLGHLPWPDVDDALAQWPRVLKILRRRHAQSFARSARRCFAYEALLRSAVEWDALGVTELQSMRTAAATLTQTLSDGRGEAQRWRDAMRPGTFEISNPRYGAWTTPFSSVGASSDRRPAHEVTARSRAALDRLCRAHKFCGGADSLLRGFELAHQARDWGKLALAVELSQGLERLVAMAQSFGVDRESLSWLRLVNIQQSHMPSWHQIAAAALVQYRADSMLRLPLLASRDTRLEQVIIVPGQPVYLGRGRLLAPVVKIDARSTPGSLASDCVVVLETCEPGFDWVFMRRPAAIVTAFGGPNAHVALRAHEVDCPALLGVGPEATARIVESAAIEIDFDQGWWRSSAMPAVAVPA